MGSIALGTRLDLQAVIAEKDRAKKGAMLQFLAQEFRITALDILHQTGGITGSVTVRAS